MADSIMKPDELTFEQAVTRLEGIASALESGQDGDCRISLEESLKLYEEGAGLAAYCSSVLKNAEQRITELGTASTDN